MDWFLSYTRNSNITEVYSKIKFQSIDEKKVFATGFMIRGFFFGRGDMPQAAGRPRAFTERPYGCGGLNLSTDPK